MRVMLRNIKATIGINKIAFSHKIFLLTFS
jgi:hypothetical protein